MSRLPLRRSRRIVASVTTHIRSIADPARSITRYYGLLGGILALVAWVASNQIDKRVEAARDRVAGVVDSYANDQTNSVLMQKLDNLQKASLREESYGESAERKLWPDMTPDEQTVASFERASNEYRWAEMLQSDISNLYREAGQLENYIDILDLPSCELKRKVTFNPVICANEQLSLVPDDSFRAGLLSRIDSAAVKIDEGNCVRREAMALVARARALNASSVALHDSARYHFAKENLLPVSLEPPDFPRMRAVEPIQRAVGQIARVCLSPEANRISQEFGPTTSYAIHIARTEIIPRADFLSKVSSIFAILIYIFSGLLGALGTYVGVKREQQATSDSIS